MPQGEPIKDFYGRLLGKYLPNDNTTRDFYGRILTKGNTVAGLIPPIENQK